MSGSCRSFDAAGITGGQKGQPTPRRGVGFVLRVCGPGSRRPQVNQAADQNSDSRRLTVIVPPVATSSLSISSSIFTVSHAVQYEL